MHLWAAVRTDEGEAKGGERSGWMLGKKFRRRRRRYPNDPIHIRYSRWRGPWPPFCEEEEEKEDEDEDDDGDQGEKHFSTESENEEGNRAICCR